MNMIEQPEIPRFKAGRILCIGATASKKIDGRRVRAKLFRLRTWHLKRTFRTAARRRLRDHGDVSIAAARQADARSRIVARSNSARAATIFIIIRPAGVVVGVATRFVKNRKELCGSTRVSFRPGRVCSRCGFWGVEQAPLCLIDGQWIDGVFSFFPIPLFVTFELVEESPVDPTDVLLADRPLPDTIEGCSNLVLVLCARQVFGVLNILLMLRKEQYELFVRRLEEAECTVLSPINYLDVLHFGLLSGEYDINGDQPVRSVVSMVVGDLATDRAVLADDA
jgi:hypothetical protein